MRKTIVRAALAVTLIASAGLWSCAGDIGPTGADGPAGPSGPSGPAGPTGVETFSATLNAASEVATPPVVSTGSGKATITYIGGQLLFRVDIAGTQNVTRAHIHGPAPVGVNAGIRVTFHEGVATPLNFTGNATLAQGVAAVPTGMTMDELLVLMRTGQAYVNIHTSTYPSGELRGQITQP